MAGRTLAVVVFAAVGGVLFGLDQGNWGGAIVKEGFVANFCEGSWEACHNAAALPSSYARFLSLGSSLLQLGAAFGALLLAPYCARELGRREAMFLGSVVTVCGCLPQAIATYVPYFLLARFIAGVGVGIVTYALPMFVSEISPAEMRGMLGCFMQLTMVAGTLFASIMNCQSWFDYRFSFCMPAFPAVIVAAGIFRFPTSPRFALVQGKRRGDPDGGVETAWKALRYLRGSDQAADEELEALRASLEEEQDEAPWSVLWEDVSIRRRVIVANMLQWLQQFTGVNAILSYGPAIFQSAQVPLSSLTCAVITNLFNLLATVVMMLIIDKLGRRRLLLFGAAAMFVFMSTAAVFAHLIASSVAGSAVQQGYGWCLLACVCLYMSSFAIAWGGVPWVYPSEIFPMSVKERAMSTSVCSQWSANFLIAFVVPQQVQLLEVSGTFLFYAVCLAVAFLLVYWIVPETKGLELEQMDALFGALPEALRTPPYERVASYDSAACSIASFSNLKFSPPTLLQRASSDPSVVSPTAAGNNGKLLSEALLLRCYSEGQKQDGRLAKLQVPKVRSRLRMAKGGFVALY